MAVRPGEENVATLFGDIHYFYGPPEANPPHHRFDKGSYVYLFENASDRRARIEIANHPGTDDQDSFDGFLDNTRVRYSYSHQCLVNITVDGVPGVPVVDQTQWHLPTYDPHNQNKYHYKLHSLDIYFWTQSDALQFVNGIRRVLPAPQVELADEPAPPSHHHGQSQDVNPLVQKLEHAAISDPTYSNPKPAQQQQGIPTFAPPPSSEPAANGESPQRSAGFVPMAYNPAAPAAPEQIKPREKTPPPEDDDHDPLATAVARDHAPPYTPGYGAQNFSTPPGAAGLPGPPAQPHPGITSPGFPPSQYGHLQRSATLPMASPGLASPYGSNFPGTPGLASPYGSNFPGSPGFAPPPPPPNVPQHLQQQQHGIPGHPTPPPVQSPGLPLGGYAHYNYSSPSQTPLTGEYGVHHQVYRPTEAEATNKHKEDRYSSGADGKPSKLGQNAERLEKGVTGMLKRFEKKFG